MPVRFLMLFILIATTSSFGQNSFSLGAKIGYGTSALPMNATLKSEGTTSPAKSGATLSTAIIGRYMIGDLFGIETGAAVNHYSFYRRENFRIRELYWKTAADLEVLNYQMPIIINYKMRFPKRPFRYILISGGTTFDWFFPDILSGPTSSFRPAAFRNLAAAVKSGREKLKGKIEFGVELQYSLKHFEFTNRNYAPIETVAYSKLNMVSINLAYFFLTKHRDHSTELM